MVIKMKRVKNKSRTKEQSEKRKRRKIEINGKLNAKGSTRLFFKVF